MTHIEFSPKEEKLIDKSNKDAGKIMFYLLIVAVVVVTPLELYKFYQIVFIFENQELRDYLHPSLVISLHIILLRRIIKVRNCQKLIKKLNNALTGASETNT